MSKLLTDTLKSLLHEDTYIPYKDREITIFETDNDTKLKSVTIKGFDNIHFALKLDHHTRKFLGKLFREVSDIRCACDAVVFCEAEVINKVPKQKYILLIELKTEDTDGVPEKIKSTKAFLIYLEAIFKAYYTSVFNNFKDYKIVSILLHKKPQKKTLIAENTLQNELFLHQGFAKVENNETRIQAFIEYLHEKNK
jgi:hypothetical protein